VKAPLVRLLLLCAVTGTAGAFLVSNSPSGGGYQFEKVPDSRRPLNVFVDSDPVPGVSNPLAVTQDLMSQWNGVPGVETLFGDASLGGSYRGSNAKSAFGVFTNRTHEVAFDDDGSILAAYGLSSGVLGITLKIVNSDGNLLDFLVVVNTRTAALTPPVGSGATVEELFRGTLLHELGHAVGLGHSPVGMSSTVSYGLLPASPSQIPTMYPFRLPGIPQAGGTLEDDDRAAVRFRYANAAVGHGSISGRVRGVSGAGINQIAVRAVGPGDSNQSHIGALTNVDGRDEGNYRIPDLPPGGYRVLIETIDGRAGVSGDALAGTGGSLGADPFLLARDELWQPGDTYDPAVDDPTVGSVVQVRAGRDTGSVDFVLNAQPLLAGASRSGSLGPGDARVPDGNGLPHFTDFFVFQGSAGQKLGLIVAATGFTPQVRLYRPSSYGLEVELVPTFGSSLQLDHTLERSGIYTIGLSARGSADSTATGRGTYTLQLGSVGTSLPAPPTAGAPVIERGAADPGAVQVGSPSDRVGVLQLRVAAGNLEEYWLDEIVVHGGGSGDETAHVGLVRLIHDRNGDGRADGGEPTLASGTFDADDGMVRLSGIGLEVDPGTATHVLVAYDVDVPAPVQTAGAGAGPWAGAAVLLALLLLRRRRAALLLVLLALPLSCGGGGGGGSGSAAAITEFDPTQPAFTFTATVAPGDVASFTSAGDPAVPVAAPASAVVSGLLTVSARP